MARNLMDILNECKAEQERLTRNALQGPPREAYTTREPEEFDREASAPTDDREDTEELPGGPR